MAEDGFYAYNQALPRTDPLRGNLFEPFADLFGVLFVALAAHQAIGVFLALFDAGLVEGIDAHHAACDRRQVFIEEDQRAERLFVEFFKFYPDQRMAGLHDRRRGALRLKVQHRADALPVKIFERS